MGGVSPSDSQDTGEPSSGTFRFKVVTGAVLALSARVHY